MMRGFEQLGTGKTAQEGGVKKNAKRMNTATKTPIAAQKAAKSAKITLFGCTINIFLTLISPSR